MTGGIDSKNDYVKGQNSPSIPRSCFWNRLEGGVGERIARIHDQGAYALCIYVHADCVSRSINMSHWSPGSYELQFASRGRCNSMFTIAPVPFYSLRLHRKHAVNVFSTI